MESMNEDGCRSQNVFGWTIKSYPENWSWKRDIDQIANAQTKIPNIEVPEANEILPDWNAWNAKLSFSWVKKN